MEEEKRFDAEVYYTGGFVASITLAHGFRGNAKPGKSKSISFQNTKTCLFWKCTREKITKICTWISL